ncbi:MAG: hypothetical protein IEMM0002_0349 [bacterium]|nr:MAG: hypothetical protein IEMM0002_0349 [bacterium]
MIKINLIALRIPREHQIIQKQLSLLAGLFIVAIVVGLVWTRSASARKSEVENQLSIEQTELKRLEAVQKKIEEFEKKKQRREQILETIKKLQSRRVGPYPFLDSINVILPPDIWLSHITEIDLNITVHGYTFAQTAVADFMRSMESSEHFSRVELSEIQKVVLMKEEIKKFTITASWNIGNEEGEPAEESAEKEKP